MGATKPTEIGQVSEQVGEQASTAPERAQASACTSCGACQATTSGSASSSSVPVMAPTRKPNFALVDDFRRCQWKEQICGCIVIWVIAAAVGCLALFALFAQPTSDLSGAGSFGFRVLQVVLAGIAIFFALLPSYIISHDKGYFRGKLAALSFDQLKVELEAHPNWLEYLPNHTEEMALIAISIDPTVVKHTKSDNTADFWIRLAQVQPAIVAVQMKKFIVANKASDQGVCQVWREILKVNSTVFLKEAPQRFEHLEYEIYLDLIKLNASHIHRVPTFPLQDRIRKELNLSI